ncbi:MAG: T9SS type A sorting domain-containing protein, partial [Phaeodactylibacter sp.]|nr:T9SS type A sorting domain-containing protein [Phaeodactylibacter sp.]
MVMVESAIPGLRVQVVDVNGKLVLEGLQKANEFQVSRLDPGLYFLLLYDEKGQCVGNKRFMVME